MVYRERGNCAHVFVGASLELFAVGLILLVYFFLRVRAYGSNSLGSVGIAGRVTKQPDERRVFHHDRRISLDGVEVLFLKAVATLRGSKNLARQ